jgi:tetraacyldisaccharide 4'-kinase
MRTPDFWYPLPGQPVGLMPRLLSPAAWLWSQGARLRARRAPQWRAPVPVLCVGNLVAGGAGKTPIARALAEILLHRAEHDDNTDHSHPTLQPHVLLRGHGGRLTGPVQVDPTHHQAADVGDEALLHMRIAPTWIGRDRVALARATVADGATLLLLDDGLQDPALAKSLSLLVIDGESGFGNGRLIPAGPLREPVATGLARCDAVVLLGDDRHAIATRLPLDLPVLHARLVPDDAMRALANETVVAFAGIARPDKFFCMLTDVGCRLAAQQGFADHHVFRSDEVMRLAELADHHGARLVTTAKDHVRLPPEARAMAIPLDVGVRWTDPEALHALLDLATVAHHAAD